MAAEQARQISDEAFAQTPPQPTAASPVDNGTYRPRIIVSGADASTAAVTRASETNRLRPETTSELRQVAWTNPQSDSPSGGFALPDNQFRGPETTPPSATTPGQSGPALQAPSRAATAELPPPAPSMTVPTAPAQPPSSGSPQGKAANDNLESLFGFGPTTNQKPTGPSTPPAQAGTDGSSIRDMLGSDPAQPSLVEPASPQTPNLQVLPPGIPEEESTDSPSDLKSFAPNPFENRDVGRSSRGDLESERDRRDREGFDGGRLPELFDPEENGPANSGTGLSCDEFRERIRSATIDKVSLDPSPPFRPDVIDLKEFEKLKDRFNENQKVRTWRSIDGRPMGTGRLDDLAYENAIIRTEFGSKEELPLNQLSEADLAYISQNWGLPTECLIEQVAYTSRQWTPTTMTYAASNLCHKPLYFEEVNLERYGHTAGPLAQPIISSAHFFLNIAVLPYKMGVHSPHECQYALGYYRPGNCAPWIIPPVPLSVKGAWYQATAITGTALLVP
ncbi:hypothetical protein Poly21_39650 [Allorhodopirellula heiligendammensis]|uniref:Uncharacterized protein n=2 Tax=Allorhodopirellula heiligendammensis TaxID=2714739 RepID=A0A5C6C1M1_9BACT|nr:hypothetical protein Poly21_39650 [Allorhodopirellula heiligendammensis]